MNANDVNFGNVNKHICAYMIRRVASARFKIFRQKNISQNQNIPIQSIDLDYMVWKVRKADEF